MVGLIYTGFVFLFGEPHEAMYTAVTLTLLNFILGFFYKGKPPKNKKEITKEFFEKFMAYVAFMIIASRLDALVVNKIVEWESPTQFLVCMFIIGREAKLILEYIQSKGIKIPLILSNRVNEIEALSNGNATPEDPAVLEAKMQELKEQMKVAESLNGKPETGEPEEENATEETKGGEG